MKKAATKKPIKQGSRFYTRFGLIERIEHLLLLASFLLLAITGLPQKFSTVRISKVIIDLFGGIETTRLIHHISAIVLVLIVIYHILEVGYKIFVERTRLSMMPGIKDITDGIGAFFYNIGLGKKSPQMGRYSFEEKIEYWAMIWGTVIMAISGFIMWDPISATRFLPGEIIPAAKAAHGAEAILAVLAVLVWHGYFVHIKRFNTSMITGKLSEEEMRHDHPLELAEIKTKKNKDAVPREILSRRKMIFFPVATLSAAVMLAGVYGLVNVEKTAITTIPPVTDSDKVYVPLSPTPVPLAKTIVRKETKTTVSSVKADKTTWANGIGAIFTDTCSMCHSNDVARNGLSFVSYADIMRGSDSGAVIKPGDPENSKLIVTQSKGDHAAQLSPDDLALVKKWIAAGAPEK